MLHPLCEPNIEINGEAHALRLTLGALAQIEDALGGDFGALQERLKSPRFADIIVILHALLAGGGSTLTLEALKAAEIDAGDAARAIAEAFAALGAGDAPPGKREAGTAQTPQAPMSAPSGEA